MNELKHKHKDTRIEIVLYWCLPPHKKKKHRIHSFIHNSWNRGWSWNGRSELSINGKPISWWSETNRWSRIEQWSSWPIRWEWFWHCKDFLYSSTYLQKKKKKEKHMMKWKKIKVIIDVFKRLIFPNLWLTLSKKGFVAVVVVMEKTMTAMVEENGEKKRKANTCPSFRDRIQPLTWSQPQSRLQYHHYYDHWLTGFRSFFFYR